MSNVSGVFAACTGAVYFSDKHPRDALRIASSPGNGGEGSLDFSGA